MSDLIIHNGLAEKLRQAASQHKLPVEEFLELLLDRLPSAPGVSSMQISAPPGTLAALAEAAKKANIRLGVKDVSSHSREILENEWGEHLTRWMNEKPEDVND
jgi:hypothetical protein